MDVKQQCGLTRGRKLHSPPIDFFSTTSVYTFHCACNGGRGPAHPAHPVKVFMGPHRLRDVAERSLDPVEDEVKSLCSCGLWGLVGAWKFVSPSFLKAMNWSEIVWRVYPRDFARHLHCLVLHEQIRIHNGTYVLTFASKKWHVCVSMTWIGWWAGKKWYYDVQS